MIHYVDLRIEIGEGTREKGFPLHLGSEVSGEAQGEFVLPFSSFEIGRIIGLVDARMGQEGGILRRGSAERQRLVAFGRGLFDALLADSQIRACYERARGVVQIHESRGLRLRLVVHDPLLRILPWEFLHDGEQFLAVSNRTPIVRYVEFQPARQIRPLLVEPPLRILVAISAPKDQSALDVESERRRIEAALNQIRDSVEVEFLGLSPNQPLTYQTLQRRLSQAYAAGCPFHILHFIGHGEYLVPIQGPGAGYLVLQDDVGRSELYSGEKLGNLLRDHPSVRLAVINACEGARCDGDNPFADVATALVRAGVPAVVAMQFSISDHTARIFSSEFYFHLALGYPVDAALAEARKTVYAVQPDSVEFGAPVLFMRAREGRIFDVSMTARRKAPARPRSLKQPARRSPARLWLALAALLLLVAGLGFVALGGGREQVLAWLGAVPPTPAAASATPWPTETPSPAMTLPPTMTLPPAMTLLPTATLSSATSTEPATETPRPTPVPPLPSPTSSPTATPTPTSTPTSPPTPTLTSAPSPTPPPTVPPTATSTPSPSATVTRRPRPTPTPTPWTLEALQGRILFLSNRTGEEAVFAMRADGSDPIRLPDQTLYEQAAAAEAQHPSDARRLVVRSHEGNLEVWSLGGEGDLQLTSNPAPDYDPAWSPDGWQIAFVSGRGGSDDVFVMDASGQGDRRLTYFDGYDKHPTWSPEGTRLAFWSDRQTGRRQIWVMNADGSEARNLSQSPYDDWDPVWVK